MVMRVQQIIKEWCETFKDMMWAMENPALGFGSRFFVSLRTVLLFAAMGLPPLLPLKMATDPPRFFADRLFGLRSWHAAVLLSTTHARELSPGNAPI